MEPSERRRGLSFKSAVTQWRSMSGIKKYGFFLIGLYHPRLWDDGAVEDDRESVGPLKQRKMWLVVGDLGLGVWLSTKEEHGGAALKRQPIEIIRLRSWLGRDEGWVQFPKSVMARQKVFLTGLNSCGGCEFWAPKLFEPSLPWQRCYLFVISAEYATKRCRFHSRCVLTAAMQKK